MKKECMMYHLKSSLHVRSIATMSAADKKSRSESAPMEQSLMKMDEATLTKMNILFRTVFYLVKKERPVSDLKKILELQNLNGSGFYECINKALSDKPGIGYQ